MIRGVESTPNSPYIEAPNDPATARPASRRAGIDTARITGVGETSRGML